MVLLMLFGGLIVLPLGAELLIRGASRLGVELGISPLVIGLTVVGFGTSAPELAVSIKAALTNHPDLILGTNIGSTILNILFILGCCALIAPLVVHQQLIWFEVPIMIGAHLLLFAMCLDGKIGRWDGLLLFSGLVAYVYFAICKGRKETKAVTKEYKDAFLPKTPKATVSTIVKQLGLVVAGLVFCVLGAGWLLDSSVILARAIGVSELVIGITIVAASTSLPEAVTSILATIKGQRDIALGNVVGSCIFNVLGNIGAAGLVAPDGLAVAPAVIRFDLPIAIAACIACLPIFFIGHKISRWEGGLFVGYYLAYTTYLVMAAKNHDLLPTFSKIMAEFVIPLTVITLAVLLYRSMRR